nr:RNA-dependent RNA polymerase [Odonatan tombus-related virus]
MDKNSNKHSARITPFTKIEKMRTEYRAPRLIQARHPSFNIKYGAYIKPIEKHLKTNPQFSKGNYRKMAEKIVEMKNKYSCYTELDHTSFDAHITTEHLRLTHTFYSACHGPNSELRQLSKQTIKNVAKTRDKITYRVRGTRMSGDVDTSLGNSLINYAIIKQGLEHLKLEGDVIVNGDDSIIFTHKPIDTEKFIRIMRFYNMESKCKPTVTEIHKVDFCQHRLVIMNNGNFTLMPNTRRVISRFGMTYKTIDSYHAYLLETLYASSIAYEDTKFGTDLKKIYHIGLIIVSKNEKTKKINKKTIKNLGKEIKKLKRINRDLRRLVMNQKKKENNYAPLVNNFEFNFTQIGYDNIDYENRIARFRNKIFRIFNSDDLSHHDLSKKLTVNDILISHDMELIITK